MDTLFDNTQQQSLMPCLTRMWLTNFPKLRALPNHLHRIVNLQRIQIEGADKLQDIVNHPGVVWLKVKNNKSLRKISNLPKLRLLLAQDCQELQQAKNLSLLKALYVADCPMEKILWKRFSTEQQSMIVQMSMLSPLGPTVRIFILLNQYFINL